MVSEDHMQKVGLSYNVKHMTPCCFTVSLEESFPSFPPPQGADLNLTSEPAAGVLMFTLARVTSSMFILWHGRGDLRRECGLSTLTPKRITKEATEL